MAFAVDSGSAMQFPPERLDQRTGSDQYAALPWRHGANGEIEVLLVTSRATGRWIIPKGWPATGLPPHLSAAKEAWEEAGVLGEAGAESLGDFRHRKSVTGRMVKIIVFPLAVREQQDRWPERFQRRRRWSSLTEAAHLVADRPLGRIIRAFRPDRALEEGGAAAPDGVGHEQARGER
jgi:8-oxo-dGTP pyrophosphatase MutT (NUDIX family)